MAYFEQFRPLDGTTLFSGTIAATGAGSAIDTTSYGSVAIQVSGAGLITAQIEGSNDGSDWDVLLLNNTGDLAISDTITNSDETYFIKTGHRYIRYNVSYYTGAPSITIVGRAGTGPSAADNLAAAFNPDTPLQVAFGNGVKQDKNGALILSDGIPYFMQGNNTFVFNAQGYATIVFQLTVSQTATVSQSIDGINYTTTSLALYGSSTFGTPVVAGIYTAPVVGQYVKVVLTIASSGPAQAAILFKHASIGPTTNLGQIGGAAAVTGGLAGTLAVGGASAIAVTPTTNPLTIGGTDLTNLTRRLLTDTAGRTYINAYSPYFGAASTNSNSPSSNTAIGLNTVGSIPATYQQTAALNVQDTAQYEGQNITELLAQLLLEMRIMNQQLYELPRLIANGQASNDPPELFRQEPSIFNQ